MKLNALSLAKMNPL